MTRRLLSSVLILAIATLGCSSAETRDSAPPMLGPGDSVAPGRPFRLQVNSHCGVERLSMPVNDVSWITDEAEGTRDWMPSEWRAAQRPGQDRIVLTIELSADGSRLTASTAGRSVVYRQVITSDPVIECA